MEIDIEFLGGPNDGDTLRVDDLYLVIETVTRDSDHLGQPATRSIYSLEEDDQELPRVTRDGRVVYRFVE
jgi:hypothetical protein